MVLVPYLPPVRFSPPAVCWVSKQEGGAADLRRCGCGCGWERERRRWEGRNRGGEGVAVGKEGGWGIGGAGIFGSRDHVVTHARGAGAGTMPAAATGTVGVGVGVRWGRGRAARALAA
jgi:hypothetical protein